MSRVSLATLAGLFAALVVSFVAPRASAHALGVSNAEYRVEGSSVVAKTTFAKAELAPVAPELSRAALESALVAKTRIDGDGRACAGKLVHVGELANDGVVLEARFDCERAPRDVSVEIGVFDALTHGHRHLARALGEPVVDAVLHRGELRFSFHAPPASPATPIATAPTARSVSLREFVTMGVEHIWSGYDHLLFLFGLVIVGGRFRALFGVVTAFTVAHSITLAMAALGVFEPSPRWVEPLIALSIAYVGIENFFVKDAARRWRLTFAFGLVHGFGFAGALREVDLPAAKVPVALVGFNAGVELGQLAVMAALLPLSMWLAKRRTLAVPGVRVLSGAVALAGLVWFVQRTSHF